MDVFLKVATFGEQSNIIFLNLSNSGTMHIEPSILGSCHSICTGPRFDVEVLCNGLDVVVGQAMKRMMHDSRA